MTDASFSSSVLRLAAHIGGGHFSLTDDVFPFLTSLTGFVMGLFVGSIFYPVISESKRHRIIMWGFRVVGLVAAIILFVILTRNFYTSDPYAGTCEASITVRDVLSNLLG